MTKRMLIDSTHAEETRVVVLDGNRLEDYDVETSTKQQLKGNIYLAKIVRVEPSLQAAFVEFGGGRHGFLAFGEIHPDYYQIPVADRKRLLELQEAEARAEEEEEEREALRRERAGLRPTPTPEDVAETLPPAGDEPKADTPALEATTPADADAATELAYAIQADPDLADPDSPEPGEHTQLPAIAAAMMQDTLVAPEEAQALFPESEPAAAASPAEASEPHDFVDLPTPVEAIPTEATAEPGTIETLPREPEPENIGGELETEDRSERRAPSGFMRNYKIQEVMRRRQILLVQVVKEERGNKGAALTTYISLAGRFSVLMPNSPRGGGISRKITSAADRRRLKEITTELDLPRGMGLIVRTAGAQRPKAEIIRDCEYLLNQWDQVRDLTMKSMAPALIYEEASLIKRAIRDVYSREVEEILVDGEAGWHAAHEFMRMLMPSHARKVQLWRDQQPLFAKAQVESQLDAMLQPTVQLRSGGYLVINQTEALVAIDVNSGRSTRERGIEETALRTNLEAAEEAARQLRLRDLAGLIVIDFIDMESRRNNTSVERRLKDALKNDRARIQVGSISHFGLLEMSRQRLRPSLTETSFVACPHCGGTGHMRSTESAALAVLRAIEDEGAKRRAAEIVIHVHGSIGFYVLNHKRARLAEIEDRFGMHVTFQADDSMIPPTMRIERLRASVSQEGPIPISQLPPPEPFDDPDEEVLEPDVQVVEAASPADEPVEAVRREPRGRSRSRGSRTAERVEPTVADRDDEATAEDVEPASNDDEADRPGETPEEGEQRRRKRRRRRRGGRRENGVALEPGSDAADVVEPPSSAEISTPIGDAAIGEPTNASGDPVSGSDDAAQPADTTEAPSTAEEVGKEGERKRRGRRGGRRRRRDPVSGEMLAEPSDDHGAEPDAEQPAPYVPAYVPPPVMTYTGPTPANPFGGDTNAFAFFDAVEEAEEKPSRNATTSVPAQTVAAGDSEEVNPPPVSETGETAIDPDAPPVEKKRGWWRR